MTSARVIIGNNIGWAVFLNTVRVDFSTFRPCCRRYRRYSQPALRDVSTNCTRENLRCLRIQTNKQHAKRTTTMHEMIKDYSMIRGADMVLRRPCGWWKYFQRVLSATSPHTGFALSFTKGALRVYPTYANGRFSSTSNWGFARSKSRTHFQNLIQVWVTVRVDNEG